MNNEFIHGKNPLERIVGVEIKNEIAIVFRELEDGSRDVIEVPHKYWILSNKSHTPKWAKLEGDQYYKWGKQYTKLKDYINDKKDLKSSDTYSCYNAVEGWMIKDGFSQFKGMTHDEISVLCFDIETTGLLHNAESKVLLISSTFRKKGVIQRVLFAYDDYESEVAMIDAWCSWVREMDPSFMVGHNVFSFDIPYLQYCYKRGQDTEEPVGMPLGRDGEELVINNYESKFRVDGSRDLHYNKSQIYGRQIVDTMFLAIRYDLARKYDSYRLKYIIEKEGLTKEGRTFYEADKIRDNYLIPEEWVKIKAYCIDDGDDALSVYDLTVPPFFYMAQMLPKPFQEIVGSASGSQLNSLMVRAYLQNRQSIPKADNKVDFEGAISFGEPGIYENSVSLDIASLYPSIMLQYKISNKYKDPSNYMLQFLNFMRDERLKNKKLAKETGNAYYKHLDLSYKILINSLYGFLGAAGLHFNFPSGAAEVTRRGRETLIKSMDWGKSLGYKIPKGDTDSITLWKNGNPFTEDEVDKLVAEINSILPEFINFELDAFYDSLVVFKAKNYAYREGAKITTKGSAIKASTKCPALKDYINNVLKNMLYNKPTAESLNLYTKLVHEICNIQEIKRWASRKTLSSTMQDSDRTTELKVMEALKGSNYREGDRFYTFFLPDESLCLVENFSGIYNKKRLLKNLFDTNMVFDGVIPDLEKVFINYALVKNQKFLPGYVAPVKVVKPKAPKKPKKSKEVATTRSIKTTSRVESKLPQTSGTNTVETKSRTKSTNKSNDRIVGSTDGKRPRTTSIKSTKSNRRPIK